MSAPKEILRLVDKFKQHLDSYKSGQYNEAQLRSEFLDPFFKALGWDMDNTQGLAEAYKDVVHEDAIRIGGAVKVPAMLVRKELLSPEWAERILSWRHTGFNVHSLVRAKTKPEAERVGKYMIRPLLALIWNSSPG